jgi:uncharacterized protein YdhG (YjbR/CyaY superfamily)
MPQNKATTVKEYLDWLPEDRRKTISKVRSVIRKHLPQGYEEALGYGVISYQVPLKTLPDTYNGQPLCYAGLAAQKNHNTLYLMGAYGDPKQRTALEKAFAKAGKKLDMGKSCVRFKDVDDLPLDAIGKAIAGIPPARYIRLYEKSRIRK